MSYRFTPRQFGKLSVQLDPKPLRRDFKHDSPYGSQVKRLDKEMDWMMKGITRTLTSVKSIGPVPDTLLVNSQRLGILNDHHALAKYAGSGIDKELLKYVWSQSETTPDNNAGWISFTNGETVTKMSGAGVWYLHVKASDNIGNKTETRSERFLMRQAVPPAPEPETPSEPDKSEEPSDSEEPETPPTKEITVEELKEMGPYKEISKAGLFAKNKMWTVMLTREVDPTTLEAIYLLDVAGNIISTTFTSDGKQIFIHSPLGDYDNGTYTLYLTKGLKDLDGRKLKKQIKMLFVIE